MSTLEKIIVIFLAGFVLWRTVSVCKNNPEMFSKQNLSSSFTTMGILALILIIVVGFAVFALKR